MGWLIGALIVTTVLGGAAKVISGMEASREAREELSARKKAAETQKNLDLRQTELEYGLAKTRELENAARSDQEMDLRENLIALAYNAEMGNQRANMESQAFESQTAMMRGDSAIESAYASLGASGIRSGSTAAGAVERQAAVNDQALDVARRSEERWQENAVIGAYASLAESQASIGNARYGADWTRQSFQAGGENYEKRQFAKIRINEAWESQKDLYQTLQSNAEYTGWDFAADALGGGSAGFYTGANIYGYGKEFGWWGGGSSSSK